jgi:D-serine deaminase-like pyridoxal phosphate-dependent protein
MKAVDPIEASVILPSLPAGLETPCLVIDLDVVERNGRTLQSALDARGVRLRPHAKTHKSVAIARIQIELGAAGLTVGTLGEAEVMAAAGITDLFLAYPLWADGPKARRLRELNERIAFSVGIDSIAGAEQLASATRGATKALAVLIELDSGGHRTGVGTPEAIAELADAARDLGLDVGGVFTHGGHSYADPEAHAQAAVDEVSHLGDAADALRSIGIEPRTISAGSTPTAVEAATGQVNEIRAGTYILGDRQQVVLHGSPPDGVAAYVAATVVSTSVEGHVVIDAGAKTLTKDRASFLEGYGAIPAFPHAVIDRLNDYHGIVRIPAGTRAPRLGEVVAVVPNHICPVVDLFDSFVVTRGPEVVGAWPVDARGRSG